MNLIASLIGGLLSMCGPMIGRVLLALGMGYVSYKGFDTSITWLLNSIKSSISSMPAEIISFLGWLWLDKAISMIFSAYAAASLVKLAGSASVTKLVSKG